MRRSPGPEGSLLARQASSHLGADDSRQVGLDPHPIHDQQAGGGRRDHDAPMIVAATDPNRPSGVHRRHLHPGGGSCRNAADPKRHLVSYHDGPGYGPDRQLEQRLTAVIGQEERVATAKVHGGRGSRQRDRDFWLGRV